LEIHYVHSDGRDAKPLSIKIHPEQEVLSDSTAQFNNKDEASKSPIALALFAIPKVEAVFLGKAFISVTKAQDAGWDPIKTQILTAIMDHYVSGKPMIEETAEKKAVINSDDSKVVQEIKELIESKIRPAVAQDGGDIIFHAFEDGVVTLELHGACSGCPSATVTLKQGIESMLKHYVPEVKSVEAVAEGV